jgi:hypothetical protein
MAEWKQERDMKAASETPPERPLALEKEARA